MISFDLNFYPRPATRGDGLAQFNNLLQSWLAALLRSGNIIDNWQVIELDDHIQVRVVGLAPDALEHHIWGVSVNQEWKKLEALLLAPLHLERIGNLPPEPTWCECASPSGRVLFTTFLDKGSPVSCFDCGQDVPLYHLPSLSSCGEHQELRGWQGDYQALDQLWMSSGVDERVSYRQLARPKSDFMKQTHKLAAQLEEASKIPTYSFLLHYHKKWGKHCPLCGRKWKWKNSPRAFLAFKCDHCRLVTSEADSNAKPLHELHP